MTISMLNCIRMEGDVVDRRGDVVVRSVLGPWRCWFTLQHRRHRRIVVRHGDVRRADAQTPWRGPEPCPSQRESTVVSTIETLRPGRLTAVSTASGSSGTGRSMSTVSRATNQSTPSSGDLFDRLGDQRGNGAAVQRRRRPRTTGELCRQHEAVVHSAEQRPCGFVVNPHVDDCISAGCRGSPPITCDM